MPEPTPNESRKSFMSRCMADDKMVNQFPERDQRYAVCNSYADKSAEYALDPAKGDRPSEVGDGMSGRSVQTTTIWLRSMTLCKRAAQP